MSLRFKAHLGLLVCSLLWGITFVVVKDALVDSSAFAYLAARFTLGALPMAWFYRADLRKLSPAEFWAGVRIGVLMFGGYAFQTAGIAETTPSKAAFITGFSVVLVPVLIAVLWRRRISAWAWIGASASLAGLYYLTVPREGIADLNRGDPRSAHEALSAREFEVLRQLGIGRTTKQIGQELCLSEKTVSTYRRRILTKLHLKTTADLIRYAIEEQLA